MRTLLASRDAEINVTPGLLKFITTLADTLYVPSASRITSTGCAPSTIEPRLDASAGVTSMMLPAGIGNGSHVRAAIAGVSGITAASRGELASSPQPASTHKTSTHLMLPW